MKKAKSILSFGMCLSMIFSATACTEDDKPKPDAPTQATSQQPTEHKPATDDTASKKEKYDYVKINEDSDSLVSVFDNKISNMKFKGSVYYKIGNDFEYISSKGQADVNKHINNSANTCYYVGSVTKQFTAVSIMMLVEQNKLSLDDTLQKFYPSYEAGKNITIKNLLTMTSGIKSYMCANGEIDTAYYSKEQLEYKISSKNSAKENKKSIMNWIFSQKLKFEPDSRFEFSDSNYYILGDIIEKVSKKSYENFVTENIIKPLNLKNTTFNKDSKTALQYQGTEDNSWIFYNGVAYSSTGLISNIPDLLKWVNALSENELLSKDLFDEMCKPYKENYGFGFFVNNDKLFQAGKFNKYSSMLSFTRGQEEIYISLSNYAYSNPVLLYSAYNNVLKSYK